MKSSRFESAGDDLDVAIVHDYLNQLGGAERVVLEMSDVWPDAPIYTSLYRPASTFPAFKTRDIRTSPLDRLPVDEGFRNLLPLYPYAFRSISPISADVVISSSSGWAHMVRTTPEALHVVYCHTPARWLYRDEHLNKSMRHAVARPSFGALRQMDQRAAQRADLYITNSRNIQRRIQAIYRRDALVLHPPVELSRFRPTPRGERLLVVSRLLPYKRIDLAVRVATEYGIGLDVVGTGPMLDELRAMAGPSVTFHPSATEELMIALMETCRAVCVCAEEDFGIVSVEAQAAGKPVVAFGRGGSLETVIDGVTGALFHEHTPQALRDAIRISDALDTSPDTIAEHAESFSAARFRANLRECVESALSGGTRRRQSPRPTTVST